MAKRREANKTIQFKGVAKQHIKYKGEYVAPGQEIIIDEKDVDELSQYADVDDTPIESEENDGNSDNKPAEEKDGEAKDGE